MFSAAMLLTACASLRPEFSLRPPLHPLLEFSPLDDRPARNVRPVDDRRRVVARLKQLIGRSDLRSDGAFVGAAFGLDMEHADASAILAESRAVERAGPADILYFSDNGYRARVAVVIHVDDQGRIKAAMRQRGAIREVVVDPKHPATRRDRGEIVNSFIRVKRRSDPPRAVYLAGQLLREARSLL